MTKIKDKNRPKIAQLRQELEALNTPGIDNYSDLELDSFLQFNRSVPAAAKALLAARRWREEHPVSIADVAQYYRAPPGSKLPPAYLVCLEDGMGDCARDVEGRPVIHMMGVIYGSNQQELQQQLLYALQRAALYRLPHHRPDEVCFVTEVMSRTPNPLRLGMCSTFRFPDSNVRSLLNLMKTTLPGSQFSVLHFCGLPSFVTSTFKMVKPFVSPEVYNRILMKSNFDHLKRDGHMDTSSILPEWDKAGTFSFDLDAYVDWRAKEEGIPLSQLPARGKGRAYTASDNNPQDFGLTTEALLGTPEARQNVVKMGWIEKRGSGMGLFATNRWKRKYAILSNGSLFYFETPKVSDSNAATRMIAITPGDSTVDRLPCTEDVENGKKSMLCLQAEGRDYIFGFSSDDEAEEWLAALRGECQSDEDSATEATSTGTPEPMMIYPASVTTLLVGGY